MIKDDADYEQAVVFFNEAINIVGYLERIRHYGAFSLALAKTGNTAQAHSILAKMKEVCEGIDKEEYFYWKSQIEAINHDYEVGYKDLEHALNLQTGIVAMIMSQSVAKAQRDYQTTLRIQTEQKVQKRNLLIVIITLAFIIIIGISILIFMENKRRFETERLEMQRKMETMSHEIDSIENASNNEINRLRKEYLLRYKEQFDYFKEACNIIVEADLRKKLDSQKYREVYNKVRNLVEDILADEDGQMKFEEKINQKMDGIMAKFREDYPTLSPHQYRLASMLFVDFRTDIISLILGIDTNTVYVQKNRLRNRIRESSSQNKSLYLDLILDKRKEKNLLYGGGK